ncbi:MAG: DUF1553 domain-containing protein, partial [Thermoleophilia bacterium]|nr:DUF1553 domain-containing protein [Thermoleophilia bacterium]
HPDGDAARQALADWDGRRRAILAEVPRLAPIAPAILDGNGTEEYLLIRGGSRTPGKPVARRFLTALGGNPAPSGEPGSGRRALADWMLDPANPFTARVMVNRVWHHLFGRGLVASVDNFGVLGEAPTHPELLDHLATEFVRDGWSVKRLIRVIATSRAYRMASAPDSAADAADPRNALWHRRTVRRLEGEALRDAILAASGRLVERVGGPSVPVHLTSFLQGRGRPESSGPLDGDGRRSLYLEVRRNFLAPMLLAFDTPIPFTTMGRRNVSNVPAQALILMNDPFVAAEARRWGDRIAGLSPEEGVRALYRRAFAREPDARELADAAAFVRDAGPAGRADLAHVLINTKEFLFLD